MLGKGAGFEPGTTRATWEEEKHGYDEGYSAANENLVNVLSEQ